MSRTFRPYDPYQTYLLPQDPAEWPPAGHLAPFVRDLLGRLDRSPFLAPYEEEARGAPPYHPRMMLGLIVYGYCVGVRSGRGLERAVEDQVPFRVLAGNDRPRHVALGNFRRRHLPHLRHLFLEVLRARVRGGRPRDAGRGRRGRHEDPGQRASRGEGRDRARGSPRPSTRRWTASSGRPRTATSPRTRGSGRTAAATSCPRASPRARRAADPHRRGAAAAPGEGPPRARHEYEAKARAREEQARATGRRPTGPAPKPPQDRPARGSVKRNTTDPESRTMKTRHGYVQGHNAQAGVNEEGVIVSAYVTDAGHDRLELNRHLREVQAHTGRRPRAVIADAGLWTHEEIVRVPDDVLLLVPPDVYRKDAQARKREEGHEDDEKRRARDATRARLATPEGRALYRRRQCMIEPRLGIIQEAMGLRRFSVRGLAATHAEWDLVTAASNPRVLHARRPDAARRRVPAPEPGPPTPAGPAAAA